MKFPRICDAIRLLNEFRFRHWHELIQHTIHPDVGGARLMDQLQNWRDLKIRADTMRVQRGRESFGAQVRHDDVPVRIIHVVGIAMEQGVTDKPLIQRDPESDVGLAYVIRANCVRKPPVDILLRPDPLPVNSYRCEMFVRGQNPVVNDCRNVSRRDVPQTDYAVGNLTEQNAATRAPPRPVPPRQSLKVERGNAQRYLQFGAQSIQQNSATRDPRKDACSG
jgi:hypothetical protein